MQDQIFRGNIFVVPIQNKYSGFRILDHLTSYIESLSLVEKRLKSVLLVLWTLSSIPCVWKWSTLWTATDITTLFSPDNIASNFPHYNNNSYSLF